MRTGSPCLAGPVRYAVGIIVDSSMIASAPVSAILVGMDLPTIRSESRVCLGTGATSTCLTRPVEEIGGMVSSNSETHSIPVSAIIDGMDLPIIRLDTRGVNSDDKTTGDSGFFAADATVISPKVLASELKIKGVDCSWILIWFWLSVITDYIDAVGEVIPNHSAVGVLGGVFARRVMTQVFVKFKQATLQTDQTTANYSS